MRLQLFLAKAGVASRRHAEEMILDGQVKVNGKTVTVLGTQVDPSQDEVSLQGKKVFAEPLVYLILNKPKGYVTTASDPEGRPTIFSLLETPYQDAASERSQEETKPSLRSPSAKKPISVPSAPSKKLPKISKVRLFSVGRLDYNTEGAILLTNDGNLANRLMHPRYGVEKIYHAKMKGFLSKDQVKQLEQGVVLPPVRDFQPSGQGFQKPSSDSSSRRPQQTRKPKTERSSPCEVRVLATTSKHTWLELTLHEGKNRQIYRMAEAIGSSLLKLARVQYAFMSVLDMEVGTFRKLKPDEIENLYQMVGLGKMVGHDVVHPESFLRKRTKNLRPREKPFLEKLPQEKIKISSERPRQKKPSLGKTLLEKPLRKEKPSFSQHSSSPRTKAFSLEETQRRPRRSFENPSKASKRR